jgi:hypothetical protein
VGGKRRVGAAQKGKGIMAKLKAMARRGVIGALVACGALGVVAPAAFANHAEGASVNASCTAVTFSYTDFIPGTATSPTNITEELFLNGTLVNTATYAETGPATFSGTFTTPPVGLTGAATGDKLVAEAYWSGNGNNVHPASNPDVLPTITLACTPLTYTGRAYDVGASVTALGLTATLAPIADTTQIATTATIPLTISPLINVSLPPYVGATAVDVSKQTGGGSSAFNATIAHASATLGTLGVAATTISSTSKTSCIDGALVTDPSTGTTIANLVLNGSSITLPSPIPVDDFILGNATSLISVELNQQYAVPDGTAVNAIVVKVNGGGLVSGTVIVGHSESDVEGC